MACFAAVHQGCNPVKKTSSTAGLFLCNAMFISNKILDLFFKNLKKKPQTPNHQVTERTK